MFTLSIDVLLFPLCINGKQTIIVHSLHLCDLIVRYIWNYDQCYCGCKFSISIPTLHFEENLEYMPLLYVFYIIAFISLFQFLSRFKFINSFMLSIWQQERIISFIIHMKKSLTFPNIQIFFSIPALWIHKASSSIQIKEWKTKFPLGIRSYL